MTERDVYPLTWYGTHLSPPSEKNQEMSPTHPNHLSRDIGGSRCAQTEHVTPHFSGRDAGYSQGEGTFEDGEDRGPK
jgi:hypothetical protein